MDPLGDWSVDANEAVRVSLHLRGPDSSSTPEEIASFHPKFTYPIFGENESIYGYKGLKVNIRFAANDLTPQLDISYDSKVKPVGDVEAEDVIGVMKEVLPQKTFDALPDLHGAIKSTDPSIFSPPGNLIESYNLHSKTYEIFHAPLSSPACKALFSNLQIFILMLIEGGSTLDLDDEDWVLDRWDVFFLYEKRPDSQYSFIGFCTVYKYWWFRALKPESEPDFLRARISQFIILPPYQGKGHGGRFYDKLVEHMIGDPIVQEITVEDPSEQFEDLRDLRDLCRLRRNGTFTNLSLQSYGDDSWNVNEWRKSNKMALRQFQRLVEMELLKQVNKKDGKAFKQYRLFVKGRLYKQNRDVLMQLDRLERIDKLDETYHHIEDDYYRLLGKAEQSGSGGGGGGSAATEMDDKERPKKKVKTKATEAD